MSNLAKENSINVDSFGLRLRSLLLKEDEKAILISNLLNSGQASDVHNINCDGYGRVWHKSILPEDNWGEIVLPYYPASWKLGISLEEASIIQVFQSAGCNYRCWFCFVDYRLLAADIKRAKYFTCESLVELLKKETFIPRVIRLSGGQPDLTPEWTPWMMKALIEAELDKRTYLWLDDNLSNDYAWTFLQDEDWELMKNYKNFGRVGCLKGYDPESFHFNTKAPSEHFYRQLEILRRLVKSGLDVYVYLVLTSSNLDQIDEKMERLLDELQDIHPNLPLRVSPLKIKPYSPTVSRMKSSEEIAIEKNQYYALNVWKKGLTKRFSSSQLDLPCYQVSIQ
ncbi:MAG TPA: hypothetical protein DDW76_14665 [Cyanobacteria bacterium UBA11369]|nr:hypothetical protein [Cyanobacteria bacterium UBA11371]HBE17607.1 hypothetical protein [Cyanobacteria bacterium UBA11367]HBE36067.1 hypothetical protein [Cyanobacteria bacterium UBA11368]HBE49999.1 hypothetical protein [Cyanobacteria bacterium UBA11369]